MIDISSITRLISALRAQTSPNSITPEVLGSILQKIANLIGSLSQVPEQDATDLVARMTQCESDSLTALQAARSAQATADGNVIDSFTHSQDEDELSLSIKQHGHSDKQVVLPAASSTGAGIMTATDKSNLDTAYRKRVNLMSAPSSESVVTLTITFGDGTTKSVTFVGATAGTGGKAGLMTKEQADQLAALVAAGPAESVRDAAGYLKQQYAAPIILRNVTDTVFDDLAIGDVYYDTGHLFYHTEDPSGDLVIGAPSRKVIYYCLADQTLYRWTGSRFVQAVSISSGDVTVPTKLSDLINDMGFLTAHQPLKTINGETITGTGNITIDGAAELKDASNHVKQSMATPVVLRNVTATVFDDLNEGDTYFDSGHLFYHTEGTSGDIDLGTPSKRLIYFSIANSNFYRWTGSIFSKINSGADIVALNGVSSNQDGTIVFTDTAGNTYTVNLNHTHPNMAKLIVCEESDLPSTLQTDTIYAQVDDSSNPTEIETLYIAGLEFAGGGVPAGTPAITKPSGSSINLGNNTGSGVSSQVLIKANAHITGDLTVTLAANSDLSFDTTNLPTGVTYNSGAGTLTIAQVNAIAGVQIPIVYSGSGAAEIDGGIVISGGGVTPKSVVVVVVAPVELAAVKLTGSQWLQTDYYPNANTEFELECQFATNANSYHGATGIGKHFLRAGNNTNPTKYFYFMVATTITTTTKTTIEALVEGDNNNMILDIPASDFFVDHSIFKYEVGTSNNYIKFQAGGTGTVRTGTIDKKTSTMVNPLVIGLNTYNNLMFEFFDLTIYRFTIKENGVNVRNYVPRSVCGVPGLYDTVTGAFISSETSTDVVAIQLT